MSPMKIAMLVGSLRKDSYCRKLAGEMARLAPATLKLDLLEIGGLPLYNQDFDEHPPAEYVKFRDTLKSSDGVLFITPEHNRSVPAALKNALDIASRPYGQSVWSGKPGAVISLSIGAIGGFGANHHLRQSLAFLNVPTLQQPEAYLGNAMQLFDAQGRLAGQATLEFIGKFLEAYAAWVTRNHA